MAHCFTHTHTPRFESNQSANVRFSFSCCSQFPLHFLFVSKASVEGWPVALTTANHRRPSEQGPYYGTAVFLSFPHWLLHIRLSALPHSATSSSPFYQIFRFYNITFHFNLSMHPWGCLYESSRGAKLPCCPFKSPAATFAWQKQQPCNNGVFSLSILFNEAFSHQFHTLTNFNRLLQTDLWVKLVRAFHSRHSVLLWRLSCAI